jgi:signal transduction histidine kinase
MNFIPLGPKTPNKARDVAVTFLILILVGVGDYVTGRMSFSVFYLIAIFQAFWRVGKRFAIFISILSAICWIYTICIDGGPLPSHFVLMWNMTMRATMYIIVVLLLDRIKAHQETLEERIRERTAALSEEIIERERLEKEILEISEREQRLIGYDLHDGLCQHLTGTAIAGQVLGRKLAQKGQPEAADAGVVVALVEEAIALAKNMARGLAPVQADRTGLMDAFLELAATSKKRFRVECAFENCGSSMVAEATVLNHLYRIAQEAISNAVRHGHAKQISIKLSETPVETFLTINDDGCGLPVRPASGKGMGLRIMKHRARIIGASFTVEGHPAGGTVVTCSLKKLPLYVRAS